MQKVKKNKTPDQAHQGTFEKVIFFLVHHLIHKRNMKNSITLWIVWTENYVYHILILKLAHPKYWKSYTFTTDCSSRLKTRFYWHVKKKQNRITKLFHWHVTTRSFSCTNGLKSRSCINTIIVHELSLSEQASIKQQGC